MDFHYNTQQEQIKLTEYGRGVQEMVEHLKFEKNKEKRNILAHTIFQVMVNLNPDIKSQSNYQQTVWDHMHEIANYELDIDNEFLLAEEVDHNPFMFYEKLGSNLMNFHQGEVDYVD